MIKQKKDKIKNKQVEERNVTKEIEQKPYSKKY